MTKEEGICKWLRAGGSLAEKAAANLIEQQAELIRRYCEDWADDDTEAAMTKETQEIIKVLRHGYSHEVVDNRFEAAKLIEKQAREIEKANSLSKLHDDECAENETLKAENERLKLQMAELKCYNCGELAVRL